MGPLSRPCCSFPSVILCLLDCLCWSSRQAQSRFYLFRGGRGYDLGLWLCLFPCLFRGNRSTPPRPRSFRSLSLPGFSLDDQAGSAVVYSSSTTLPFSDPSILMPPALRGGPPIVFEDLFDILICTFGFE
jgi:hypothetical protein